MVFKKSILISNDIWEKVKSNNNNFSSIKKKKKKIITPSHQKAKITRRTKAKTSNYTKTFYSIIYELNEREKECRKKSNLMKNAKILKGIQADEEILKFFRPNEKPFICVALHGTPGILGVPWLWFSYSMAIYRQFLVSMPQMRRI